MNMKRMMMIAAIAAILGGPCFVTAGTGFYPSCHNAGSYCRYLGFSVRPVQGFAK